MGFTNRLVKLASNTHLIQRVVIKHTTVVLVILASVSIMMGYTGISLSLLMSSVFGATSFRLLVRAQNHLVKTRHYGQLFLFFIARLLTYAIPVSLALYRDQLSLIATLIGLLSYKAYFIGLMIYRGVRKLNG